MANKICWNWELVISFLRLQKEYFFTFTLEIVCGPVVAYMLIFFIAFDMQYPTVFIPRKRYIYICRRVHLILLIFTVPMHNFETNKKMR